MSTKSPPHAGTALVAAGHPEVAEAARRTLADGGNAFDAVVAAGMASAVAEPGLTSLGGGGFLLARTADGHARLFDFFVDTPGRGQRSTNGMRPARLRSDRRSTSGRARSASSTSVSPRVGVPGTLAGLRSRARATHARLCRSPTWSRTGPCDSRSEGRRASTQWQGLIVMDILRPDPDSRHDVRRGRLFEPGMERYIGNRRAHFSNPGLRHSSSNRFLLADDPTLHVLPREPIADVIHQRDGRSTTAS